MQQKLGHPTPTIKHPVIVHIINPQYIRVRRAFLSYTLQELADLCGMALSYLSDIEHGRQVLRSASPRGKRLLKALSRRYKHSRIDKKIPT